MKQTAFQFFKRIPCKASFFLWEQGDNFAGNSFYQR